MKPKRIFAKFKPYRAHALAIFTLVLLTLWVFHYLFFADAGSVLSLKGLDLDLEYFPWRMFGSEELRHGRFPLWNPYSYFGSPFLANPETALFYPLNWLHLILPVAPAINLIVIVHIFLTGFNFYFWQIYRRIQPFAALVAAVCFMFSGAVFCHVWAGHLSNLASMAWAPLIFLAIDGLFSPQRWRFCLLGVFAVALQTLAGHTQYLFFTALIASAYFILKLLVYEKERLRPTLAFILLYVWGASIAAAQLLLTAATAVAEGSRAEAMPYQFAAKFSLPPENLLTLLVPGFFGDLNHVAYWGRFFFWEMCFFVTLSGLVLATLGLRATFKTDKKLGRIIFGVVGLCVLLALGEHTPLYYWCYKLIPMLDHFRGPSKFIFQASLFIAVLIAAGMNDLLQSKPKRRATAISCFVVAGLLLALSLWLRMQAQSHGWQQIIAGLLGTHDVLINAARANSQQLIIESAAFAFNQTLRSALVFFLLGGLFLFAHASRWIKYSIGALAIVESLFFAGQLTATFTPTTNDDLQIAGQLSRFSADDRILWSGEDNAPMRLHHLGTWGYSSMPSQRALTYMAYLLRGQNIYGALPMSEENFNSVARAYFSLTRTRMVVGAKEGGVSKIMINEDPLGRFFFAHEWRAVTDFRSALAQIGASGFDLGHTVLLEAPPAIEPATEGDSPQVLIENETSDAMDLSFDLQAPAILVMTDAFAKGWQARGFADSVQTAYQVAPADGVVRAIAVSAGHQHFHLQYRPRVYAIGKWISLLALGLFLGAHIIPRLFKNFCYPTKTST